MFGCAEKIYCTKYTMCIAAANAMQQLRRLVRLPTNDVSGNDLKRTTVPYQVHVEDRYGNDLDEIGDEDDNDLFCTCNGFLLSAAVRCFVSHFLTLRHSVR